MVVRRPTDRFGALHEDYTGLTLQIGKRLIWSEAHLYHALKLAPDDTEGRGAVLGCASAAEARSEAERRRADWDPRWEGLRNTARLWTLKLKLAQHPGAVGTRLTETGARPIVVDDDEPWGMRRKAGVWRGANALGTLWMQIRGQVAKREGNPIRGVRTPEQITALARIDGAQIEAVARDGRTRTK